MKKSGWTGREVVIHPDGACSGNPGPGGWGVVISDARGAEVEEHSGRNATATTNNRMELTAAIEGLERTSGALRATVVTDSQYVKNGITQWIRSWKRNGWRASGGKAVKNRDLWERLDEARAGREVEWQWIKGHSGAPGNERADTLACEAMRSRPALAQEEAAADKEEEATIPFEGSVADLARTLALMRPEARVSCVLKVR